MSTIDVAKRIGRGLARILMVFGILLLIPGSCIYAVVNLQSIWAQIYLALWFLATVTYLSFDLGERK